MARRFEELVAAVILSKHPGAEQLGGKDGGADVLLERLGKRSTVWQVKHYPRDIHWPQCEESLDSAVANHGAEAVIFAFPRDMSYTVKKTFKRRLKARHPEVEVSYLSGSQIIAELREREDDLVDEFFGPDPRDQAQALVEHLASRGLQVSRRPEADEISQHLELADAAGQRDRHFRTEVAVTTGEVPPPAWVEAPSLVLTTGEGDRALRIAAWPEGDGDLRMGDLRFPGGDEGRRLRWEVTDALLHRREVRLPPGVTVRLPQVPEAVRAISDVEELEDVVVTPQAHPATVGGELDGERIERALELVTVPPLEDPGPGEQVTAFAGIDDEFSLFFTSVYKESVLRMRVEPAVSLTPAWTPGGALEASRLMLAWYRGTGTLDIPTLLDPEGLSFDGHKSEKGAEMAGNGVQLFENLVAIQAALDVDGFELGTEVGEEEFAATATVLGVLETGSGYIKLSGFGGEFSEEHPDEIERHRHSPSIARFPVYFQLFGNELNLGIGEAELPTPSAIELSKGSAGSEEQFELRWSDEPTVPFKLISRPGAPPAEIGIWLPGEAPPLRSGPAADSR